MNVLLLGANSEYNQALAQQIGSPVTIVTTVKDAQRFMRRNLVVVLIVTQFDRQTMAFVESLGRELSTYGSVLDALILAGYGPDSNGPAPQGATVCQMAAVPGMVTESLADAEKHDPNRPGRAAYSYEKPR